MASILVIKPGMLTTVQDRGRWGFQSRGVPVAGPMDPRAHRAANALVENASDAATLEITLLGPELEFDADAIVAVAGARFDLTIDGRVVPSSEPVRVRGGSRLRFGKRIQGSRAYLAVHGGIDTPLVLGSRATHVISAMGGVEGRALRAGDRLPVGAGQAAASRRKPRSMAIDAFFADITPAQREPTRVRVLPGPQLDYFSDDAIEVLQSGPYVVGGTSDRMGFRLEGPVLQHTRGADTISDATPLGALQVPASGQPIVLMADRQTTGGYPKIATVIAADIGVIGQLAPGDALRFVVCSPAQAISALIGQERALMALESGA